MLVALVCAAAAYAKPPSGDPKGLALLDRVHGAYRSVPGVTSRLRLGTTSFATTIVLKSGVVVAEQLVVRTPTGTTTTVARGSGPTFARDAGKSCWRRLSASDQQSFDDLGMRFPDEPGLRVKAPRSAGTTWKLDVVASGQPATFVVDRKSLRVRAVTFSGNSGTFTETVSALRSAPKVAVPAHLC